MSEWVAFGGLLALVGSLLVNVLATEAYAWFPRLADRLVRFHASRLPSPLSDRMREEWQAMVSDTPGNLAKLWRALDLFRAIPRLRHGFYYPGIPHRPFFDGVARALDLLVAAAGLVFSAPLMLIVAAAIKAESRGPVLFGSPRLGRHKREFILYKFRTVMACECEECGTEHPYHVTRTGRLIRRLRLDELPQYLNVALGHMSLVGPRAIHPDVARQSPIPPEMFSVRPGLTGRAQVSGVPAGPVTKYWAHRVALDLQYILRRGFRENLRIIWATIRVVLFGRSDDDRR